MWKKTAFLSAFANQYQLSTNMVEVLRDEGFDCKTLSEQSVIEL